MSVQDLQGTSTTPSLNTSLSSQANRTYRIMVVDDEEDLRDVFKAILEEEDSNWEVSTAADGIEALAKAEATKFDLVLLDIIMPSKDGIQTLQDFRDNPDKYGKPVILMLTNLSGDVAIEEAKSRGAQDYMVKIEYEPAQVIEKVREWLGKPIS